MAREIDRMSVERVRILLMSVNPKAVAMNYIRDITGLGNSSIRDICEFMLRKNVEVIETSAGRMYRWREKGA